MLAKCELARANAAREAARAAASMAAESQPADAKAKLDEASALHEHALNYARQGKYDARPEAPRALNTTPGRAVSKDTRSPP